MKVRTGIRAGTTPREPGCDDDDMQPATALVEELKRRDRERGKCTHGVYVSGTDVMTGCDVDFCTACGLYFRVAIPSKG